jgi:hypothetical protein
MDKTYTRLEAQERLGLKGRSSFHYLREQYPQWFVVVEQGQGKRPTLYDAQKIDTFAQAREVLTPKKGKQS